MKVESEIAPEAIIRARLFYERPRKGPKPKFPFEPLYEMFCDPKLTIKDIARKIHSSHSHVFFLLNNFFCDIIPAQLRDPQLRKEQVDYQRKLKTIRDLEMKDDKSAAAILTAELRYRQIPCERIYTSDGLMKKYVKVNGQVCYVGHNKRPRRARSEHFRRYFVFPTHKETIDDAKFVVLIAESEQRKDFYIFPVEKLIDFHGLSKTIYIPDITTPPLKRVQLNADQVMFNEAHDNWEILKTAA